jgi:hypothetical protein
MLDHLGLETFEEGLQTVDIDVFDAPVGQVLAMTGGIRMVGKVVVPEDGLSCRITVLHRVPDTLGVAIGRRDPEGTDLGVAVAEVLRDLEDRSFILVLFHRR